MNSALRLVVFLMGAGLAPAQTTLLLEPSRDNTLYVEPFFGSLSNGSGDRCIAGVNAIGDRRRALLHFDVAAALPAGATITGATLELVVVQSAVASASAFALHALQQDWGEGSSVAFGGQGSGGTSAPGDATWLHTFYPGAFWTTPGGDFAPTPTALAPVAGIGTRPQWSSPTLVADVQSWLDSPATNFGWLLKIEQESTTSNARAFGTRESTAPSLRPSLSITYATAGPAASVAVVGSGCSALGGAPCVLGALGLPQIGNPGFTLEAIGPADGTLAYLFFAPTSSPSGTPLTPSCALWLDLPGALALVGAGSSPLAAQAYSGGSATWPLPIPNAPALAGFALSLQAINLEGGSGLSATNAVDLIVGH